MKEEKAKRDGPQGNYLKGGRCSLSNIMHVYATCVVYLTLSATTSPHKVKTFNVQPAQDDHNLLSL